MCDSPLSECVLWSDHIRQGHLGQGPHCPRDASSKKKRSGTPRSGTHSHGIIQSSIGPERNEGEQIMTTVCALYGWNIQFQQSNIWSSDLIVRCFLAIVVSRRINQRFQQPNIWSFIGNMKIKIRHSFIEKYIKSFNLELCLCVSVHGIGKSLHLCISANELAETRSH